MALLMSTGVHFGGLLGGGGLAILAAGCAYLQAQQASTVWQMPVAATAGLDQEDKAPAKAASQVPATVITETATPVAEPVPVAVTQKPALPAPDSTSSEDRRAMFAATGSAALEPPTQAQTARQLQTQSREAALGEEAPKQAATFIVKFKANEAIDNVIASWRRDKAAAEATFAQWAEGDAVFGDMRIVGCSYSGELILETRVPAGPGAARAGVDRVLTAIRGHASVSYADPDFTAQPGRSEN